MTTQFLHEVSIFKDLSEDELNALKDIWTFKHVAPRERIVAEGSLMREFFVVGDGIVHVRRLSRDHEVLLARFGRGGFFGEMNLFAEANATASVYAMGEVRLLVTPNNTLRDFMASRPEIGYKITANLLHEVSARLRHTNERLVNALFWPGDHPEEK
jgi:CRP-like cAMP-binding protein